MPRRWGQGVIREAQGRVGRLLARLATVLQSNEASTKRAIVMSVFPVMVAVIYILIWAPLVLLSLATQHPWVEVASEVLSRAGIVFAIVGAFVVCKIVWPKRPSGSGRDDVLRKV